MADKLFNNALAQYDNEVKQSKGGLFGSLSNVLGSVTGIDINKLNKLADSLSGFDLSMFNLDNLKGYLTGFLKAQLNTLKALGNDTLNSIVNAGTNFTSNIIENLAKDIKKTLFIDDKTFCNTIKALYYTGGDLAYNNNYLRNTALKNDWIYTLKFCDQEYPIKYNIQYKDLQKDIDSCSKNSCWKNLDYIFEELMKDYNSIMLDYNKHKNILSLLKENDPNYKNEKEIVDELEKTIYSYKEIMLNSFKNLIVYSYSYIRSSDIKHFFDKYPSILKPKYFGTTDDEYNNKFIINSSDINIMMPFYSEKELSSSDKATLNNIENQTSVENNYTTNTNNKSEIIGSNLFNNALNNYMNKINDEKGILTKEALTRGSQSVIEKSRDVYTSGRKNQKRVIYKEKNVSDYIEDAFKSDKYILPRNQNIKTIYILLTNKSIFGENIMVNEDFYNRCKYKSVSNLSNSIDKVKGMIPTFGIVQGIFDLTDALESTIYNYEQSVESSLFNPKTKSIEKINEILVNNFINIETTTDYIKYPEPDNIKKEIDSETGKTEIQPDDYVGTESSNKGTENEIRKEIEKETNSELKKEISNKTRYLNNLSMIQKRDIIIKYIEQLYNLLLDKNIDNIYINDFYSKLIFLIFGIKNQTDPSTLNDIFKTSTNETLTSNLTIMLSIYVLKNLNKYITFDKIDDFIKNKILNSYYETMYCMEYEMFLISFLRNVFLYDSDYLSTYCKNMFNISKKQLQKLIDNKTDNSIYYKLKDLMTNYYKNYDRFGIFGYNNKNKRIQYTNIEFGDFNSITSNSTGVYFLASLNSPINGIFYLPANNTDIQNTNINNGNWTDSIELFDNVLFINNDKYIYTVLKNNPKNIFKTDIEDYQNWEIKTIDEYKKIFLISKNNSGVKIYNESTGNFDNTLITTGGNFKIKKSKYLGYVFYSDKTDSPICTYNNINFSSLGFSNKINNFIEYVEEVTITVPGESLPDGGQGPSTTRTDYIYHMLISSIIGLKDANSTSSSMSFIPPIQVKDTSINNINCYICENNNEYYIIGLLENSYIKKLTLDLKSNETPSSKLFTVGESLISDITKISDIYETIQNLYIIGVKNENKKLFAFKNDILTEQSGINSEYINNFNIEEYIFNNENTEILHIITDKIEDFLMKNNNNWSSMLNEEDRKPGWNINIFQKDVFLTNNINELGIYLLNNNSFNKTNITDGKWIIKETPNNYFALSCDGYNKGIRISSKNTISFTNIGTTNITYNDFKGSHYDKYNFNTLFIGTERKYTKFNIDNPKYDLDEFIYELGTTELNKLAIDYTNKIFDYLLDSIINKLLDDKTYCIKIDINNNKPDLNKIYYIKKENLDKSNGKLYDIINDKFIEDNEEIKKYIEESKDGLISIKNVTEFNKNIEYFDKIDKNRYEMIKNGEDPEYTIDDVIIFDKYTKIDKKIIKIPNPNEIYYIKQGDKFIPVTNITVWDKNTEYYIKGEGNLDTIIKENEEMFNSFDSLEKNSNLHLDLSDLSNAKNEFDIDDEEIINNIILDQIINTGDKNAFRYLLNFEAEKRKMYISTINVDANLEDPNYNKFHSYTSNEYLNSDDFDLDLISNIL